MSIEENDRDPEYWDQIDGYRQPVVTSIGIVLGFLLAFLANWAVAADGEPAVATWADWAIVLTLLVSAAMFTLVLFRMLNNRIFASPGLRYQATLRIYLAAIVLAFFGLSTALFL